VLLLAAFTAAALGFAALGGDGGDYFVRAFFA